MKYGESTFDILYLIFAILTGIIILVRHRNKNDILMGAAALILGLGDSFHLVPRVLNYFLDYDFTWYLGFGKLVTSVTMTIFYIFVFLLYRSVYCKDDKKTKTIRIIIYVLAALRIALCIPPGNNWFVGEGSILWACLLPMLGMLMLPKTVCYILMLISFIRKQNKGTSEK